MKALPTRGRQRTAFNNWMTFDNTWHFDPNDFMWTVDWRFYDMPNCSLYIVTPDNKWPCKIGISVHPEKRIRSLQTSVWRPLSVAHCFACAGVKEAKSLERKVHETLTDMSRWLHGEWFDMRPEEAADIVRFSASLIGVECTDKIEDEWVFQDVKRYVEESMVVPANQKQRIDDRHAARYPHQRAC